MAAFRISGFSGLVPRLARQLLAPNQAQVAVNCRLTSGDLRPRSGPRLIFRPVIDGEVVSIFRMEKGPSEKWLAWSRDVDVARSPIADNEERTFYYTGDGEPRVSNFDLATQGTGAYPAACFVLGVSPPIVAPTVAATGGSSTETVSRSYVYTFVTPWDEESEPSPPSIVADGKPDGTWSITGMAVPPENSGTVTNAVRNTPTTGFVTLTLDTVYGLRAYEEIEFDGITGLTDLNGVQELYSVDAATNTVVVSMFTSQTYLSGGTWERTAPHNTAGMTKRIYRILTSSTTGTEYQYLVTVTASVTSYSDTIPDDELGEVLPSEKWKMPPANMRGIVILPNGVAAGFTGNEIWLSEPFKPYAWPIGYMQSYDQDIVAIGVSGTTLVGMTEGNPFTITGVDPITMGGGMQKLAVAWPCMSKRSVASFAFGVGYAAPQGLVIIGVDSDVVTKDLFTLREWSDINPHTFIAATADNRYYSGYTANNSSLMFVIDKTEAASFVQINQKITAIWTDPATGRLYVANDGDIFEWEGDPGTKLAYEWRSKLFLNPVPVNFGACKIDADFTVQEDEAASLENQYEEIITLNSLMIANGQTNDGLADPALSEYPIGGDAMYDVPAPSIDSLQFQYWANNEIKLIRQITNTKAFRLPSGYKSDNCEFVLSGNVKVTGVVLAETMDGLKQT